MDFEAWEVDLNKAMAVHSSGFKITVEGDMRQPSGVVPGRFPEGMSAIDQATLLRCGLQVLMRTAARAPRQQSRRSPANSTIQAE